MEADLILKGGTLICMDPQRSVRQADLIISGGRIAAIESATRQKARRVLDVRGAVVLPGFVQCRTRLGMSFFRYPEEPASRDRQRRLAALEAGHDRASAFSSAALGVAELLRSGTTAVLDMGDATQAEMLFQAADAMGLRGVFGRTLADKGEGLPKALCASVETSLKEGEVLCRRWHNADGGRLRYAVSLRGLMWSSKVLLAKAAQTARGQGLLLTAAVADAPLRIKALPFYHGKVPGAASFAEKAAYFRSLVPTDKVRFGAVKLYCDGSIISHTAPLDWPGYWDGTPNAVMQHSREEIFEAIIGFHKLGLQTMTHTNSNLACGIVLDAVEEAQAQCCRPDIRHRMEHCYGITPEQLRRAKALGVAVQFFTPQLYYYGDNHLRIVGRTRAENLVPTGTAERLGVSWGIHSDPPGTPLCLVFRPLLVPVYALASPGFIDFKGIP